MKKSYHMEEVKMSEESIDSYLKSIKARNYPLEGLGRPVLPTLCGVVLHDEAKPFIEAESAFRKAGLKVAGADFTKRFRGWTVDLPGDHEWKRVLLLETGMGSMNASLVMYELEASLRGKPEGDPSRRVLKIGTCSGLYPEEKAGTVLIPDGALDDEGATKWNVDIPDWDIWQSDLLGRLKGTPCKPYGRLTTDWREHLKTQRAHLDWAALPLDDPEHPGEKLRAAIWSVDNFHGVRSRVKKIYPLIQGHVNHWVKWVPVGLENECSSHFSASCRMKLPIAAALVVSWSCEDVLHLLEEGQDMRGDLKDRVHNTENRLIVDAVNYLLQEYSPG
jgi:uridine phosphorylase